MYSERVALTVLYRTWQRNFSRIQRLDDGYRPWYATVPTHHDRMKVSAIKAEGSPVTCLQIQRGPHAATAPAFDVSLI